MASASRLSAGTVPTLVLAAALVSASATAVAQGRPLRLIVPFPPGPGVDMIARTVSDQLSQTMGRTVVVDNRPGAGSVIGVDLAAKSPADGNTLLFINLAYAINAAMVANLPYDPLRDLAPVTVVATLLALDIRHRRSRTQRACGTPPVGGAGGHAAAARVV